MWVGYRPTLLLHKKPHILPWDLVYTTSIGDILGHNALTILDNIPLRFYDIYDKESEVMKLVYQILLVYHANYNQYLIGDNCINSLSKIINSLLGRMLSPDGCVQNKKARTFEITIEHKHSRATKKAYGQIMYYTVLTSMYNALYGKIPQTFGLLTIGNYIVFGIESICNNTSCNIAIKGIFDKFSPKKEIKKNKMIKDIVDAKFSLNIYDIISILLPQKARECEIPEKLSEIFQIRNCKQRSNNSVYISLSKIIEENLKN